MLKLKDNKLWRYHSARLSIVILCIIIASLILLPLILKLDPTKVDPEAFAKGPSANHILGTDSLGRDILARLIYGGRTSIIIAIFSSLIAMIIGSTLGMIAGYYRGLCEFLIMGIVDVFIAFPPMIIILVAVVIFSPGIYSVIIIMGVLNFTQFARVTYAGTLPVSKLEYTLAAKLMGESDINVIFKYILPNISSSIYVTVSYQVGQAIITESAMSFLGLGIQPPDATWGNMLNEALSISVLSLKPWIWLPASLVILSVVLSINTLGDRLRDVYDPKSSK